ncbi:sulfatase family protein [Aporhodopirellula aestuarii]|uniref:Sulfatase-like hydrolase/transferase n=1 Tax=Aporhodopirellula aestuarii TaxID=2950107 RepID=A0ABT0U5I4_9BACT|nr:sulfatase-like hydrolase/transferase [Aporhodopirellula aestuarii]MCM2372062.1 sulfatase-like hydrolase/transferase [Aporhodopirellula aestuarii]
MKPLESMVLLICFLLIVSCLGQGDCRADEVTRPNVVLVMADDMGWGQTGYYQHPILKTPHLNEMAANGLRLDRFYAAGPVCSPTRASVLTGRTHNRTGVLSHGYALHRQERSLASAMQAAGYATSHFGKWHLNGIRGPGVPVLASDDHHPGHFGFDHWLTVTNFFDVNPIMSRMGEFEEFEGDSSEIVVAEALKHIGEIVSDDREFFTVIWYGSPHSPWEALPQDQIPGEQVKSAHHHGELVAMDRSIGTLRSGLKQLGVDQNTLIWFCSDNGGLAGVGHDSVGGLRGHKGTVWEGGIRVPAIVEWPAAISPRVTSYPASTMDIFPTLVDLLGLPSESMLDLVDGMSIKPLFFGEIGARTKLIPFRYQDKAAIVDNNLKIVQENIGRDKYLLFDLDADKTESNDLFSERPADAQRLRQQLDEMVESIANSQSGVDYAEGKVTREGPHGRYWREIPEYQPYLADWAQRPEYKGQTVRKANRKAKSGQ